MYPIDIVLKDVGIRMFIAVSFIISNKLETTKL